MAQLEVIALDTATPQLRAPGGSDTYLMPKDLTVQSTVNATNVEVTNVKAKDGTAAITIADSTGNVSLSANLTFSSTAQRITGDFSNATLSNRLAFQTSTTNGNTIVGAFPNGTGVNARLQLFSASDPANASTASMEANAATSLVIINADKTGTGTYLPMTFYTGGSERMRLDTSGNLGIGTASPNKRFSVISDGSTQFTIETTAGANDIIKFDTYNASAVNGVYTWSQQGSERMRIDSSGNVGIGNTVASTINTVNGVGNLVVGSGSGSEGITIYTGTADTGAIAFADGTTTTDTYRGYINYAHATDHMAFWTAAAERMRIDSSGNVGIGGTASSFSKFEVTGTLPTSSNTTQTIRQNGTLPSGSTSDSYGYVNVLNTAAASFTCSGYSHYFAFQSALGAGSAVTNQFGFHAGSTLTGATNNFGFYSDIASGSNRWNFYAAGTAQNYMAGRLGINNTAFVDSEMLRVTQASANTGVFIDITAASSTASAGLAIRKQDNNNTTAQTYVAFAYNAGASGAGGIQGNGGTGPQFFNSSDARLKENVADLDGQLAKILALKPRKFDFINGPKDCTGFIAQEMETVYPDAVGEDVDGFKTIGGISVMEARLIKAIQELTARVAELESK